jgi:carbon-monoxide dehydrogenase small subunit
MKCPMVTINVIVNGEPVSFEVEPYESALDALRNRLKLKAAKEGCGIGECGACTILVDGKAVNSCLMLAPQLDGRSVETAEGLAKDGGGRPLQEEFVESGAIQCGFCTPGMLMSAKALLDENPHPDRRAIIRAISGNLCRCTGYSHIVQAIESASSRESAEDR